MNIHIQVRGHTMEYDLVHVAMLFWPGATFSSDEAADVKVVSSATVANAKKTKVITSITCNAVTKRSQMTVLVSGKEDLLTAIKTTFYKVAAAITGITPPWGILTGIRPMNIYEKLITKDSSIDNAEKILAEKYLISDEKISLLTDIFQARKPAYKSLTAKDVSLYISIPFCPTKCRYCSFVSSTIQSQHNLVEPYLELLMEEINERLQIIRDLGLSLRTVYVGGGTPGILTSKQIAKIIESVYCVFPPDQIDEFCFEMGRPETVTDDKLSVLKQYAVNRICVNTQTLNDSVLQTIGRNHTEKDFTDALEKTLKYDFSSVNVDLIAGLPGESVESHIVSLKKVMSYNVSNITVHTLCIKRASNWLSDDQMYHAADADVTQMLAQGKKLLYQAGYKPYYLYRQKNTVSNGENTGYAKDGKIGLYNIYMMEDVHTVIGCGAGASSKVIQGRNHRIDRFINMKYPLEYIKHPEKSKTLTNEIQELLRKISK